MITPQDIDNKEFSRGRGYKDDEVDAFLDEISETLKALAAEKEQLQAEVQDWKAKYDDTLTKYGDLENSLYTTLESAKSLMNDISASSEKRAAVIITNAQLEADTIVAKAKAESENLLSDSELQLKRIKKEDQFIREKVTNAKTLYTSILANELKSIENMDIQIFGEKLNNEFDNFVAEINEE